MHTRNQQIRNAIEERRRRVFETKIEFIDSDSFTRADAEAVILAPTPEGSRDERHQKAPAGTSAFLAALYEYPLLTQPQEHHLLRKMNYLKYRASVLRESLDPARVSQAEVLRFERYLSDAMSIRNRVVQSNLRLVVSIAKKLVDRANSFDDLVSEGIPPLIRSVEIFDFDRGTRLSTYATWAIRNCLHRVSPKNHKLQRRFRTSADLVFDSVTETKTSVLEDARHYESVRETVRRGLRQLGDRDRKIVKARFALDGSDRPRRFREIAEELNISTERVRQLLARSIGRLQEVVTPETLTMI